MWTGRTVRASGGDACQLAMSVGAVSAADAVAVIAEIVVAVVVETAAERTVEERTKARLKTWYEGSERPCVGERELGKCRGFGWIVGKRTSKGKRTGEGEDR